MQLECFPTLPDPPRMIPGRPDRPWMDAFGGRSPYRCLPLTMATTTGWEILCPFGFTAEWNGGPTVADLVIIPDAPADDLGQFVSSHFAFGTLTFHTGYLFRTPAAGRRRSPARRTRSSTASARWMVWWRPIGCRSPSR